MRLIACLVLIPLIGLAADLEVTKVILYKHGVGYFERAGEVGDGDSAALEFKASEMDDVLKSLTVEQTGGEGVSAVRYDSSDPLEKRLEVFPFRLGAGLSLSHILDQFKGAELELTFAAEAVRGAIVSARTIRQSDAESERQRLLLLVNGAIRSFDPEAAAQIQFTDPKIQGQFADYLAIVSRSRNSDKRTVTIESAGSATRVVASYVAPTPVWKSSYRLVLGGDRPILEGWAIVDNTSGEDWEDVRLSLVSGLPVSFVSRLYQPKYVTRPVVALAQDRAWQPKIHGGAIEEARVSAGVVGGVPGGSRGGAIGGVLGGIISNESVAYAKRSPPTPMQMQMRGEALSSGGEIMADRLEMASSVATTALQADLGDLFEYAIDHPVTIRKSESAMLPFLREQVDGRRLYIYDESSGSQHPLRAVEVKNSSGATLDGGAITVYDAGAYAGEALVETVKAGDKRMISYAVDLGSRITAAFDSSNKLQSEFHLRRGVMTTETAVREVKTFTIRNVDPEPKTLVIEHPVRGGYELVDAEPAEKTATAYRFEVDVKGDSTVKFPLAEERMYSQTYAISNMNVDQLLSWVRNKDLSEQGRLKLEAIAEVKRKIVDAEHEENRIAQQVNEINEDQGRLRNNISTLRNVAGQQQKVMNYSEQLAAQEGVLAGLRDRRAETRRLIDELSGKLNNLLETTEF